MWKSPSPYGWCLESENTSKTLADPRKRQLEPSLNCLIYMREKRRNNINSLWCSRFGGIEVIGELLIRNDPSISTITTSIEHFNIDIQRYGEWSGIGQLNRIMTLRWLEYSSSIQRNDRSNQQSQTWHYPEGTSRKPYRFLLSTCDYRVHSLAYQTDRTASWWTKSQRVVNRFKFPRVPPFAGFLLHSWYTWQPLTRYQTMVNQIDSTTTDDSQRSVRGRFIGARANQIAAVFISLTSRPVRSCCDHELLSRNTDTVTIVRCCILRV